MRQNLSEIKSSTIKEKHAKEDKIYSFSISENIFNSYNKFNNKTMKHLSTTSSSIYYIINKDETKANVFKVKKNFQISPDQAEMMTQLTIKDEGDGEIFNGETLNINPYGYDKSLRGLKDGHTFFGTVEKFDNMVINDYIVKFHTNRKRLFVIFFDVDSKNYFIRGLNDIKEDIEDDNVAEDTKDYSDLSNIFIKIAKITIVKEIILSINSILISLAPIEGSDNIKLTLFYPKEKSENILNDKSKIYTIGRRNKCDFIVEMSLVSKIHCSIYYDKEEKGWVISDGCIKKPKGSTNGTWKWLRAKEPIPKGKSFYRIHTDIFTIDNN